MKSIIRLLPEEVINTIAAGEVIENPSSVVKELVENSIDAGASSIHVEIQAGGREWIRVADDGKGMGPDDALLCLERHATSKLKEISDLESMMTMGFRGEALATVAAISRMTLTTSPDGKEGTVVVVEGGKVIKCASSPSPKGTRIEVRGLFYNVPVRRQFQRSPQYDAQEILRVVSALSLAHPEVAFTLIRDGQRALFAPAVKEDFFERILQVMGEEWGASFRRVKGSWGEVEIEGVISLPTHHRPNRSGQHLFLNRRAVQSYVVAKAVREGYGTTIPPQRYPLFVLRIILPPSLVDVNVHPQKKEVRLRREEELSQWIKEAVSSALQVEPPSRSSVSYVFAPPLPQKVKEVVPLLKVVEKEEKQFEFALSQQEMTPAVLYTLPGYVLISGSELFVLDQRRAHERVIFHQLQKSKTEKIMGEPLLLPIEVELTPLEADRLRERIDELEKCGILIREGGNTLFFIDTLPHMMSQFDVKEWLQDEGVGEEKWLQIASRGAYSTKKKLSHQEAKELIQSLWSIPEREFCPRGQPTYLELNEELFQTLLGRKK